MADKSKGKCSVDTVRMSKSKGMSENEKPVEAAEELLTPVILSWSSSIEKLAKLTEINYCWDQ